MRRREPAERRYLSVFTSWPWKQCDLMLLSLSYSHSCPHPLFSPAMMNSTPKWHTKLNTSSLGCVCWALCHSSEKYNTVMVLSFILLLSPEILGNYQFFHFHDIFIDSFSTFYQPCLLLQIWLMNSHYLDHESHLSHHHLLIRFLIFKNKKCVCTCVWRWVCRCV